MNNNSGWFKTLLSYAENERGKFILSVVLSVLSITAGLLPYFCIYKIIDMMIAGSIEGKVISFYILWALLFYAIKVGFFALSTALSHHVAFNVVASLRRKIVENFLHAPLGEVQKFSIGEIKNALVDRVENIEPPLAHFVPEGTGHIVLPVLSITALFFVDWRIALSSLITVPFALVCMTLTFKISGENFQKYSDSNSYMNSTIVEYTEGIEVIKAFGKAGVSYEKYSSAIKDYKVFVVKWMKSTWVTMKLAFALFPSTILGTLPVSLYLANKGSITASEVTLAVMLSMSMVSSLARLEVFSESINQMGETVAELEKYINIKRLPEKDENISLSSCDVKLENVHFSYSGKKEEEVLHGISLVLPQGKFTALAGPSGSGKSTIAKLIARFWDVNEGRITIGGKDIRDMSLAFLSDNVSFVAQDNFLFKSSILENIRMGKPSATDEEVMEAARLAQCEEFINKLPDKYDTNAGEAGNRLSGGEKQRIAIARMILKNAPIVILDEATAFTDPENEDKLQESIAKLTQGKTLLVIAHRLSTIRKADNIVVLNDGRIEAEGTQEELLEKSPLYKDMWLSHIGARAWAVSSGSARKEEV